jgi:hypothetical protein
MKDAYQGIEIDEGAAIAEGIGVRSVDLALMG